jgi:hypothetical protein
MECSSLLELLIAGARAGVKFQPWKGEFNVAPGRAERQPGVHNHIDFSPVGAIQSAPNGQ